MTIWDVAVIGAGVAGSATATRLAHAGLRVILLDKGTWPRHKVCGEFLSPEGADVLNRIGVWTTLAALRPPRIHRFVLTAGAYQARHELPVPGWGVSRWVLDHLLWDHAQLAGVTAWSQSSVTRVTGTPQKGFVVTVRRAGGQEIDLRARAVVCAAGRFWRSQPAHSAAHPRRKRQFVGVKTHLQGLPLDAAVELHVVRGGYCGLVQVTDGLGNLCCWVRPEALRCAGGTPMQFLVSAMRQNPHLHERIAHATAIDSSWTTVSYTYRPLPVPLAGAIWHVGDCAAMVAPLTGDGMGMALHAAELAATLLEAAFRQELSWREAATTYTHRWQEAFVPRLRWGDRLETIFLRPRLAGLACLALNLMPPLVNAMYRRTRDINPGATHVGEFLSL